MGYEWKRNSGRATIPVSAEFPRERVKIFTSHGISAVFRGISVLYIYGRNLKYTGNTGALVCFSGLKGSVPRSAQF